MRFYNHLLHHFGDKLLSLHVDAVMEAPKNGFCNLEELCIWGANYDKINNIIKTGIKNLKRIHLEFMVDQIENDNEKLEDVMIEVLSLKTLEFISIKMDKSSQRILNTLQRLKFVKRERLKIQFNVKQEIEKPEDYYLVLNNKLDLNVSIIKDWMIVFKCIATKSMEEYHNNDALKTGQAIVLWRNNKDCKINGTRERWLFPCVCNKY